MNYDELKKALLSEIESCENNDLLLEALLLLVGPPPTSHNYSEAKEPNTAYKTGRTSPVPQEHWELLKAEREEFLKGNIKATAWEDFKKKMFEEDL